MSPRAKKSQTRPEGQTERLLALLKAQEVEAVQYIDEDTTFVTWTESGRTETAPLGSTSFVQWVYRIYYNAEGAAPSPAAIAAACRTLAAFARVGAERPADPDAADEDMSVGEYRIRKGGFERRVRSRDGENWVRLSNFVARITDETLLDDGAQPVMLLTITGRLATQQVALPTVRVPAGQFNGLLWVLERWGARAEIAAGFGARDHLRLAIQQCSPKRSPQAVFGHLGWREINGVWRYLSASGAVGASQVIVDLEAPELRRYAMPVDPVNPVDAVRQSVALLDLAPHRVTVPLLAATVRAVLCEALRADVTVWVEGPTGALKSALVAVFLSHFGLFDRLTLPAAWTSTANFLERMAFLTKDAVLVIDDWAPASGDMRELQQKAERVLRAQGNLSGRGRLRADTSVRTTMPPRGLVVSTGEQHPAGGSLVARVVLVEVEHGTVDQERLTAAQGGVDRLPHALAAFTQWLAPQMPVLGDELRRRLLQLRSMAGGAASHRRIPENAAQLLLGLDRYLDFGRAIGALTDEQVKTIWTQALQAMHDLADRQEGALAAERPVLRFLRGLIACLVRGTHVLVDTLAATESGEAQSTVIGWDDQEHVYLNPEAAYQAVVHNYRDAGEVFPIRQGRIMQDLAEAGLSIYDPGRTTTTASIGERKRRVIKLPRVLVEKCTGEEIPPPWKPPVRDSESR